MNLAQGIAVVVPLMFAVALIIVFSARRRAQTAGRTFTVSRTVGITALAGGCGAAVAILVLLAFMVLNSTVLR